MSRFAPNLSPSSPISRVLPRPPQPRPRRRPRPRLSLERLEDRTVPSTVNLAVTSLAGSGPGTLRSAIIKADAGSAKIVYKIEFKVIGTITLERALPDLSKRMNLIGLGPRRINVHRDPNAPTQFGIFVVDSGAAVKITGLKVTNGWTFAIGPGGGINNSGTLTVSHSTITNDAGQDGGGIYNSGTLTINCSTISGNTAYNGGGIDNSGTLTISHSTIFGNQAGADNLGGGIDNSGTLSISHTTISRNIATTGGGIYNDTNGILTESHDTITRNQAYAAGGGIGSTGTLSESHNSVSNNTARIGGGLYNNGAGLAEIVGSTLNDPTGAGIVNNGSTVHLKKTVVDGVLYLDQDFS